MTTQKQTVRQFDTDAEELKADRREKDRQLTMSRRQARHQKLALRAI